MACADVAAPVGASILVLLLHAMTHVDAVGTMNTLSAMWGSVRPSSGYYGVCAIQPQTLLLSCNGNFVNDTTPPQNTAMWGISGGSYFSCGLTYPSHNPVCWGVISNDTAPVINVSASYQSTRYSGLSAGGWHACAVRDDGLGTVDCWGSDYYGQSTPPSGVSMQVVTAGSYTTYGLRVQDHQLSWWGRNWKGLSHKWSSDPNAQYSAIFAGTFHFCGIELITRKALCWGTNDNGQCDAPSNYTFSSLAAGDNHTCGLRDDNHEAVCWGANTYGQCKSPSGVPFSEIAAGDGYTCGVRRDQGSEILCWGNYEGNLDQLVASEGMCQAECASDQYYYASGKCPRVSDKVCMDCRVCGDGSVESSPCGGGNDTVCVLPSNPSPPPPSPSPSPPPPSPSSSTSSSHSLLIVYIIVGVVGSIVLLAGSIFFVICCNKPNKKTKDISLSSKDGVQELTSSTLQVATSNYDVNNLLGSGASCHVYKGTLQGGQVVAIKRPLDKVLRANLFAQELDLLKRLNHICLVNLLGYCKQERILVFEFMDNGSLFDCLFVKKIQLDWKRRIKIAAQAARGLDYLHNGARPAIIHRDVKSANVLLDINWNAHIADFGMSVYGPDVGHTHLSHTSVVGTPGYVDPEYASTLQLTAKSDVYSFGVVLLELLTGRRACHRGQQSGVVAWAYTEYEPTKIMHMLDQSLRLPADISSLVEMMELALQCVTMKINDRPDIVFVSRTLERCLQTYMDDSRPFSSTIDLTEPGPR